MKKGHEENFEVRGSLHEAKLKEIGELISSALPASIGFTLVLFDYGKGGSTFYISSASRGDTIEMLDELKGKLKKDHEGNKGN